MDLSLPSQLLQAMEQTIMEMMRYAEEGHGDSANRRWNFNPKKPQREKAYRRYKKLLEKLCKKK